MVLARFAERFTGKKVVYQIGDHPVPEFPEGFIHNPAEDRL